MKQLPNVTEPAAYRIRVAGRVSNGWSDFMNDVRQSFSRRAGTTITTITGVVSDQAALFGMLCRIRDLRLTLISAEYLPDIKKAEVLIKKGEVP